MHDMCPELTFTLFGISITFASYSLLASIGAAAGVSIAFPLLKKAGLRGFSALSLLLVMAVFFLIGARLMNYIVNPSIYGNGLRLTSLRFAGFSLYGGVLGAFGSLLLWSRISRRSPWPLLDTLVLPSAVAFVFARIGCYLNGCCIGKATDSFLGVVFPAKASSEQLLSTLLPMFSTMEIAVYPTQLFEAGLALIGLIPALWLYNSGKIKPGTTFLIYGIWFTAMRWAVLPLRTLSYSEVVLKVVYPTLYGFLIFAGVILLWNLNKKDKRQQTPSDETVTAIRHL